MSEEILAAIAALRTDIMARLDVHADALGAIREDIAVNMAATDRAVRIADNTRDEVRSLSDIVSAMRRQIRRLNSAVFHDDKEG